MDISLAEHFRLTYTGIESYIGGVHERITAESALFWTGEERSAALAARAATVPDLVPIAPRDPAAESRAVPPTDAAAAGGGAPAPARAGAAAVAPRLSSTSATAAATATEIIPVPVGTDAGW